MVATSLLATSALLGTYLGNPRLGRAYATGVCTAATETEFKIEIAKASCTTIDITESFTAISAATIASGDTRPSLIINGVGEGITITGGRPSIKFRLLDNQKEGLGVTISNLTITGFVAPVFQLVPEILEAGGAIYSKGAITVTNSTFSENKAYHGGGFYSFGNATVTNSTFSDNMVEKNGGGFASKLTATVTNSNFSDNTADNRGGGFESSGTANVINSTFSDNTADNRGGGFYSYGAASVTNSTFSVNTATNYRGGGFYSKSTATVFNSTFTDNTAPASYGGGFRSLGKATVTYSTFSGNAAGQGAGGFASQLTATVSNSTFSKNTAVRYGGGFNSAGAATVTNSTFSGNTAGSAGGGFAHLTAATVTNSIFNGNSAPAGGAIFSSDITSFEVSFSIFNTYDTVSYYDDVTSVNQNLILTDIVNVILEDPLLGDLQNNGGSTLTMEPGAGSPAIDSGSNAEAAGLDFDQRGTGFARIANVTVDMGAVEVQGSDASSEDDASSDEGSSDGVGVNSLTTVLLKDQSGLDDDWSDTDIFLGALNAVLKEKPESKLKVLADGSVKLTAFLPTDRAFRKLAFDLTGIRPRNDKAAMRVIESLDLETIEKVLLYHVVLGDPIGSSDALKANGLTLTTLSGETFSIRVTKRPNIFLIDLDKNLRNPKVLLKRVDINSGNRQIAHVINRVLIPVEEIK